MTSKFDTFRELLHGALGARLASADDFLDLFAEDVVFEFPYAPPGFPKRLDGRGTLAAHLARFGPLLDFGELELKSIYPSRDAVVFEFSCAGRGTNTGVAYDQNYISVVTLREGRIARYQDYWNPLIVLAALGGSEVVAALGDKDEAHD